MVFAVARWMRIDRRETSRIDAELDRVEAARSTGGAAAAPPRPWWLDHPQLRARLERNG